MQAIKAKRREELLQARLLQKEEELKKKQE